MPTFASLPLLKNSGGEPAQGVVVMQMSAPFKAADGSLITRAIAQGKIVGGVLLTETNTALSVPPTPAGVALEMWIKINEMRDGRMQPSTVRWLVEIPATATVAIDALVHLEPESLTVPLVIPAGIQALLDGATASATASANSATGSATSATAAATSATGAATSASGASTSATTVTNKATAADASAVNAVGSASTASTSAGTATTKANDAGTSATSATASAATATTKAADASTSASNAATTSAGVPDKVAAEIAAQSGKVVTGTGSPQGFVTAGVGVLYVDTASALGVSMWRKASSAGNTGWVTVEADTGLRALTTWTSTGVVSGAALNGMVPEPGVAGGIYIRRILKVVKLYIVAAKAGSDSPAVDLPGGFSPGGVPYEIVSLLGQLSGTNSYYFADVGLLGVYTRFPIGALIPGAGPSYACTATWESRQEWPSSLPGTAA